MSDFDRKINKLKKIYNVSTYKELADKLGVSVHTINTWKQRKSLPKKIELLLTQKELQIVVNDSNDDNLKTSTSQNYDIPLLSATVSAGSGIENFEVYIQDTIPVPKLYFKTTPNLSRLKALKVVGDSMVPTLNDSDIVIVEETDDFCCDGIYVINYGGELRVKRLIRRIDGVEIKSDNPLYGSEFIKNNSLKGFVILGRVLLEIKRG